MRQLGANIRGADNARNFAVLSGKLYQHLFVHLQLQCSFLQSTSCCIRLGQSLRSCGNNGLNSGATFKIPLLLEVLNSMKAPKSVQHHYAKRQILARCKLSDYWAWGGVASVKYKMACWCCLVLAADENNWSCWKVLAANHRFPAVTQHLPKWQRQVGGYLQLCSWLTLGQDCTNDCLTLSITLPGVWHYSSQDPYHSSGKWHLTGPRELVNCLALLVVTVLYHASDCICHGPRDCSYPGADLLIHARVKLICLPPIQHVHQWFYSSTLKQRHTISHKDFKMFPECKPHALKLTPEKNPPPQTKHALTDNKQLFHNQKQIFSCSMGWCLTSQLLWSNHKVFYLYGFKRETLSFTFFFFLAKSVSPSITCSLLALFLLHTGQHGKATPAYSSPWCQPVGVLAANASHLHFMVCHMTTIDTFTPNACRLRYQANLQTPPLDFSSLHLPSCCRST